MMPSMAGPMKTLALTALIAGCLSSPAMAEKVTLTCVWTATTPSAAPQTVEVAFDQELQRAWLAGNGYVPAAISETQIAFDIDTTPTVHLHFIIDRTAGRITVTGKYDVLYSGQCKVADVSHRAF
jgi:hypothetical protein